jgi:multidrug efflux pump
MTVGTIFTLLVVPSIYVLLGKDHSHDRERDQAAAAALPTTVHAK